ncbi:MAG TPA: xanthine dehydrogenase family protein molybdopterin-binding subunit [Chloroflexota bacterium]|nr:xanthine dehydrogenase family protein molybdopterin-binding subunit [Chloroflexota bacterium]
MPSPVGQNVGYIDGIERVRGQVSYVLNAELPGCLVGRILRSPYAHARVLNVDTSKAEKVPGVIAVLSRNDLIDNPELYPYFGPVIRDTPVVAIDKVRFIGDAVAAVAAMDEEVAQEALDLIEVEYEELPGVFDPEKAIEPGAPILHESFPPQRGATFADIVFNPGEGSNVLNHFKLRKGDVDAGFAQADRIFEDTFRCPPVQHVPLEPHVAMAQVEAGRITIWSGTQTPHVVRAQIADIFQAPLSQVRIIVHTLGGGYGAKCYPKIEPLVSVLAWKAKRAVKIVLRREEDFLTVTKHQAVITLKTGVDKEGRIIARKATCCFNAGAYSDISPRLIKNGGYATAGPYRVPNVWVDSYAIYTNIVPAGAFRGYGVSQAAWAYESQMDMIAEALGRDPLEYREFNVLHDGDTFATGETVHDMHYRGLLLDDVKKAIGWQDGKEAWWQKSPESGVRGPGSKRRGKAITCVIKGSVTPSTSSASCKLNEDGSLNVLTSSVEMGQGAKTALAQLAAEAAELPFESINVSEPDTDSTPYDQQTSSSRTTYSMGTAVTMAVNDATQQLKAIAADQLEIAVEDLVIREGRVWVKDSSRSLSYTDVIRKSRVGNILGNATFTTTGGLDPETGQGVGSVHWHHAAGACEVEVDTETGKIEIVKFHSSCFAGRVVNPRLCELQIEGSTLFGVGQSLFEEMIYDGGQLTNPNLSDYMIPSFEDVPETLTVAAIVHSAAGEVHGIGETSVPPVMPAVANAVYNAIGVRIKDLPLTPEKILRALKEQQA